MDRLLEDQTAIITGGTAGIGKAIAMRFAEQGARVAIFGTDPNRGEEAVKEIHETIKEENKVQFFQVDVSKGEEVKGTVEKILSSFGKLDILVNNAGITRDQLLMKMADEEWDQVLSVNVNSLFYLCRAIIRPMMKAKKGKIINVSSVVGLSGNAGQVNYASSKAAVIGFTKALALEVASRGICVNCIAPGFIKTRMTDKLSSEQQDGIMKKIPLGHFGDPKDIAHVALFLACSWSDYMTGQVVTVDGGMVMS